MGSFAAEWVDFFSKMCYDNNTMNRNYQKELDRIIQKRGENTPRVLLHACCGVCSSSVLEYLTQYFDVTLL